MHHGADISAVVFVYERRKVGRFAVKRIFYAHLFERVDKLHAVLRLELWHFHIDFFVFLGGREYFHQLFATERGYIVIDAHIFVRQERRESEAAVLIGLHESDRAAVLEIYVLGRAHKVGFLFAAGIRGEFKLPYIASLIRSFPLRVERYGVYKHHNGITVRLFDYLGNHAVGVLFDPRVYTLYGFRVAQGR